MRDFGQKGHPRRRQTAQAAKKEYGTGSNWNSWAKGHPRRPHIEPHTPGGRQRKRGPGIFCGGSEVQQRAWSDSESNRGPDIFLASADIFFVVLFLGGALSFSQLCLPPLPTCLLACLLACTLSYFSSCLLACVHVYLFTRLLVYSFTCLLATARVSPHSTHVFLAPAGPKIVFYYT